MAGGSAVAGDEGWWARGDADGVGDTGWWRGGESAKDVGDTGWWGQRQGSRVVEAQRWWGHRAVRPWKNRGCGGTRGGEVAGMAGTAGR